MKKKIVSMFLVMALMLPMIPVPASASALVVPGGVAAGVTGIVSSVSVMNGVLALKDLAYEYFAGEYSVDKIDKVYNCLVSIIGYGQMPMWKLQKKCDTLNAFSRHPNLYWEQFFQTGVDLGYWLPIDPIEPLFAIYTYFVCDFDNIIGGWQVVEFQDGQYVIANSDESFIFSDPLGRYPYASDYADTWFPAEDIEAGVVVAPVPEDALNRRLKECRNMYPNSNIYIGTITLDNGLDYKVIYENTGSDSPNVWCDYEAKPYALPLYDTQAGQDRDYNNDVADQPLVNVEPVTDIDENFILQMFPDGTFTWIDNIDFTYDDSNKVYNIDASTSYDIDNNTYYNYSWSYTYYIDYTSITYIGQTEEYNERYEYYYTLPDGRSSADLTEEELQTLNTTVDVLPYIRSADDTSIRALYHFDGDIRDSSFWNYIGAMSWQQGASITYMDAGAFNGALYLDETDHQYTITLPSGLGSSDFMLQFRLYQSHTLTPQNDSYLSIGDVVFLRFNGESILDSAGNVIAPLSIGNWQEICLQRTGGNVVVFHNGVPITTFAYVSSLGDTVGFVWGAGQQTYKYFDELRVLNKSLYPVSGYIPTVVPYDTNLSLVLPDSHIPLADEYWTFNNSGNLLPLQDFSSGVSDSTFWHSDDSLLNNNHVYHTNYGIYKTSDSVLTFQSFNGFSSIHNPHAPLFGVGSNTGVYINLGMGIFSLSSSLDAGSFYSWTGDLSFDTPYTFSLVFPDGALDSFTFSIPNQHMSYGRGTSATILYTYQFTSGMQAALIHRPLQDTTYARGELMLAIFPPTGNLDFVYMEIVPGTQPNTGHEFVSSLAPVHSDFRTPTLAVRTDLNITGYQIGGVRLSLPEKGLVWAMVESGRITSLQIYNGQAWEECDGRIWTGQRWIPYYAYDVLLLKDLYDVVGTDPTLNPIYTETGFWTWLQNAWKDMITRLDMLISVSGGGGVVIPDDLDEEFPPVPADPITGETGYNVFDYVIVVKDGIWAMTTGIVRASVGTLQTLADGVVALPQFFNLYVPNTENNIYQILEEGG